MSKRASPSMYTVTALALGLGLSVADVGCKRSKESNTPDTLRSSIDPRLNKLGLIIPQQFTAELAPGTIIDGADESVICAPSEVIDDDAVSEASPDGLDDPLKLGAGMLARVKEQAGGVTAVHLDLQGAALKELSGDFKSPKDPACAAKVLKLQDAGKNVLVVTGVLTADVTYTIVGDAAGIEDVLGVSLSGGAGTREGALLGYKAGPIGPPDACEAEGPCKIVRRIDGACRCVRCETSVIAWAESSGAAVDARKRIRVEPSEGIPFACPNMAEGTITMRAQGMVAPGILDESKAKTSAAWKGCLAVQDAVEEAQIADACVEGPEVEKEMYIDLRAEPKRDPDSGDVRVEVRNLGTDVAELQGGAALLREFNLQLRVPERGG
ncbi:MAG: hypothetical protein R3A51_21890 [Nannocystaceae bacterium]|nr:hypothetical protein [Myxococcales bacterium]